jgi:cellobiose PTS system EIIC component
MITKWISEKLAPAANRFSRLRAIDSIVGGFQFSMPIILIGAIFQIIGNIVTLAVGGEGDIISVVNIMNNLTFGLLGLVFAYGIAYSNARHQNINPNTAGILAISLFLILAKPEFVAVNPMTSQFQIDFS